MLGVVDEVEVVPDDEAVAVERGSVAANESPREADGTLTRSERRRANQTTQRLKAAHLRSADPLA